MIIENYNKALEGAVVALLTYLPKVAGAILIGIVGNWVINRITRIFSRAMEARQFDISLRGFLKSLVAVTLKVLLLFSIAGMLGIETTSFVTILGAAGLAVGLALQGSLSNFAGGVLILIFKPFKVGDTIDAQGKVGKVQEIQIFNTILLTSDNKAVIVPNGPLSNGTIVNISREGILGFDIKVDIETNADFEAVRALILPILESDQRISKPKILLTKLSPASTISIEGVTGTEVQSTVVSDLNVKIKRILQTHGIAIAQFSRI
ncbi:MAG TPA: mechanosensitive ion channel domain-containing protein [Cytophagales bacterium]|nr:mechanosensitive ion channel domain-containing protein [Cytophagales bacterium]